jgi:hypothetical protein
MIKMSALVLFAILLLENNIPIINTLLQACNTRNNYYDHHDRNGNKNSEIVV